MNDDKKEAIIEAILYAAGREVQITELMSVLELSEDEVIFLINKMKLEYEKDNRGIDIINVERAYQLATKKEYYEYLYQIFDKRNKPNLSQAALETLSIIAYNPKITRAEIENIRGVNSDGTIYKLLEYNLIENTGKLDAPGRPTTYSTTTNFLKMFGMKSIEELPDLPKYKVDENEQIVIDEVIDMANKDDRLDVKDEKIVEDKNELQNEIENEAPMPREEIKN